MLIGKFEKQPIEVKDYVIDLSAWLAEKDDTLDDAVVSIECISRADDPALTTLKLHSLLINPLSGMVSVWLSDGLSQERYKVSVTASTTGGRVDQSEFIVKVKEI
jgi:hypothetical protein